MSDDAMTLFNAMRPPSISPGQDIRIAQSRPVQTIGGARDLHELAMDPSSPSYRARIPRPPCFTCLEDHTPNGSYDHPWTPEPQPVHDEPVAASAVTRRASTTPTVEVVASMPHRVALYVGRGDTYVIAVEEPPDWDQTVSWKVKPEMVLPLINLARALNQKVVDKTGGDLLMLEQDNAREHAQNNGRGAPAPGDRSPRLPGPDPNWPKEAPQEPDDVEN